MNANDIAQIATRVDEVEISFVLPCLNESATLAACIQQARQVILKLGLPGEIVVADNGSDDGSQAIARSCGARVIDVPIRGYGAALIYGCQAASGKYIIMADTDGSYDLHEAIPMLERLRKGYDLVVGSRLKGRIMPGAMPWKNRYIGNPGLTGVLNIFFHSGLSDAHCGLRAFSREAFAAMNLRCTGMEFASEMIVKATLLDLRKTETPITYYPDGRSRPPHLRPWRDGWRHLRFLLLYSPRWLYLIPGIVLLLAGLLINTFLNLVPESNFITIGNLFFGTHWTVPATLATGFGMQILLLGLIVSIYSIQSGLYPASPGVSRVLEAVSLEKGLLFGITQVVIGLGIEGTIMFHWMATGFGELSAFRLAMYGLMWIMLGAEWMFNSFVIGLLIHQMPVLPITDDNRNSLRPSSIDLG